MKASQLPTRPWVLPNCSFMLRNKHSHSYPVRSMCSGAGGRGEGGGGRGEGGGGVGDWPGMKLTCCLEEKIPGFLLLKSISQPSFRMVLPSSVILCVCV